MGSKSVIRGDTQFTDTLYLNDVVLPADTVGDTQFIVTDPLTAEKQEHRFLKGLAQVFGSAATAERRVVHRAHSAGNLEEVRAGLSVANIGAATVTIDVYKNGTTILTGTLVLTSSLAAYAFSDATISGSGSYVAGDVLEVVVTVAAGGGTLGQGLYVDLLCTEAP